MAFSYIASLSIGPILVLLSRILEAQGLLLAATGLMSAYVLIPILCLIILPLALYAAICRMHLENLSLFRGGYIKEPTTEAHTYSKKQVSYELNSENLDEQPIVQFHEKALKDKLLTDFFTKKLPTKTISKEVQNVYTTAFAVK